MLGNTMIPHSQECPGDCQTSCSRTKAPALQQQEKGRPCKEPAQVARTHYEFVLLNPDDVKLLL